VVSRDHPLRLRQLLGRLFALSGAIVLVAAVAGTLAYIHLLDNRRNLLQRIDPSELLVGQLLSNYLDQETGIRGYALSGHALFLQPYQSGLAAVATEDQQLAALLPARSEAGHLLAVIRQRASAWQTQFAQPSIAATGSGNRAFDSNAELMSGTNLFDSLRQSIDALRSDLSAEHHVAERRLATSSDELAAVMIASLVVILLNSVVIWVALRRVVLGPLSEVAAHARVVAGGDLEHEVGGTGPVEVAQLAAAIEAMRQRIFAEVATAHDAQAQLAEANAQLAEANAELARSNEDLEQFAYVASHDLQEPLRKVASFCQLLEQRYADQLDERGTQYIAFAVDGAKRMQVLINDLLAFSRIGRTTERFVDVDLAECLDLAVRNLAGAVEATGATVGASTELPTVHGDRTLLVALLQNLVGNAIKFHGDAAPDVQVAASRRDDGHWLLSVTDNGIGIESRFAERIFVIFQRLHGRDAYSGTGIGLAMCRKIVEFHGGQIWLDTEHSPGTRFYFTLPPNPVPPVPPAALFPPIPTDGEPE
jgi:signal transduction histidine kinase